MNPRGFAQALCRAASAAALCGALLSAPQALTAQSSDGSNGTGKGAKVAIVIGNQDYESVENLANARKDAQDIAALLKEFDFRVFEGYDLDKLAFEELLRTTLLNIPENAEVVFYYAGHGIQIGRRNYLLPTDAKFDSIYDVPLETMTLDRVIDTLAARASAHVAILDSCRNNPFRDVKLAADLDANLFETRTGFDVIRTPLNSLVAYSTSPGAVAMDGDAGGNSPYTKAILQTTRDRSTTDVSQLFPVIRERVYSDTDGMQVPWESSTLVRPFYLTQLKTDEPSAVPEPVAGEAAVLSLTRRFDREVRLGASIQASAGSAIEAITVTQQPEKGQISFDASGGRSTLTYSPVVPDVRALEFQDAQVTDTFEMDVLTAAGDSRKYKVELDLLFDPCDLQAGDALDINGVGVFRLPNELDLQAGLAACTAAVQADPATARFHYQLGRLQQGARMFDEAFENFTTAAEANHVRAYYAQAVMLGSDRLNRDVTSVPYDPARALELLERGVAAKDPYAMHRLGKQLLREGETTEDRKRGFELLERSVELGHTFSMNELGFYFLLPDTDHYLPERGMKYLRASQIRKDIYGFNNLGNVALRGMDGRPPDFERALSMFKAASDGGHPTAPSNIARMIVRGELPGRDATEALTWYDLALKRGDAWGGANGAVIILKGQVDGKTPSDAAVRLAKASQLPDEEPAARARKILDQMGSAELDPALQMLLVELGQPVTVDGAVGPATLRALENAARERGIRAQIGSDPLDRLLLAAQVYWAKHPIRYDLF